MQTTATVETEKADVSAEPRRRPSHPAGIIRLFTLERFALLVVMVVTLRAMLPSIQGTFHYWNAAYKPSWIGFAPGSGKFPTYDLDTYLIHGGLLKAPRFEDTLRWWTGTWVGQIPFYRPLTSLVFWGEWKLFGDQEARYNIFGYLFHLLAAIQFCRFSIALFRRYRFRFPEMAGLLASLIFLDGFFVLPERRGVCEAVFGLWKNQPDSLCAFFFFLSLRCYLRAMESPPQNGAASNSEQQYKGRSALTAAVIAFLTACACKEAGVFLSLILIPLEGSGLRSQNPALRRDALRRLLAMCAAMVFFLVFRTLCLHTLTGFKYGSNGSWPYLLALSSFGPVSMGIIQKTWPALLAGGIGAAFILAARIQWSRGKRWEEMSAGEMLAWPAALLACLTAVTFLFVPDEYTLAMRPFIGLQMYFMGSAPFNAVGTMLFLTGVVHAVLWQRQLAVFGYVWLLLALGMTLFSPGVTHRYYLMDGGTALMVTAGLLTWRKHETSL